MEVVVFEAGGTLVGGTAEEITAHIQTTWDRGQAAIVMLREELGEKADDLVPLGQGGVLLLKLQSVMHDTCNTANAVPALLEARKGVSGEQFFGAAVWNTYGKQEKKLYNYFCGNHTRNLPIDAYNRRFEKWISAELGEQFAAAAAATGPTARLEKCGLSLLRSMIKLVHEGYGAYAKGDGPQVKAWLRDNGYEGVDQRSLGRVELSKRQDWCLEVSEKLHPMVRQICLYTVDTLVLDANVLRDSVLMRLELHDFEAYIHANAIMWFVCFGELRALTNSKAIELNPLELAGVYDKLWEVGSRIQTPDALSILDDGFRPWPKLHPGCPDSIDMYDGLERNYATRRASLLVPNDRRDAAAYRRVLLSVMKLFGEGIHESLQRTMADYLEATDGRYKESRLEEWEKSRANGLLCHNNPAERPFAIMKWLQKQYPSMNISSLSHVANAIVNGTYNEGGAAATVHEDLKQALRKLCCVRDSSLGAITKMVRDFRVGDKRRRDEHVAQHRKDAEREALLKAQRKAAREDAANETILTESEDELNLQLGAMVKRDGSMNKAETLKFLKAQYNKRVLEGRDYSALGPEYRSQKTGKLVMNKGGRNEVEYMSELLRAMIVEDGNHTYRSRGPEVKVLRKLATVCPSRTSAHSVDAKIAKELLCAEMIKPEDDPDYVALAAEYKGKLMYDEDADPMARALRVLDITFSVYRSERYWMATCIENVLADNGAWVTPERCYLKEGSAKIIDPGQLRDYVLMNVTDPDGPLVMNDVSNCVAAHEEREASRMAALARPGGGKRARE